MIENLKTVLIYRHDGKSDFPHGAGPSEAGIYVYLDTGPKLTEPSGPFTEIELGKYLFDYVAGDL